MRMKIIVLLGALIAFSPSISLFANTPAGMNTLAYRGEPMERTSFSGLTLQVGYSSLSSAQDGGQQLLLNVSGPDLLFGAIMVQNGLGTQIEIDVLTRVELFPSLPSESDDVILPDLISGRYLDEL